MSTDNSLNPNYPDQWYRCLIGCFSSAVKFKRSKRINLPFFYSSYMVHLINQKETTLRSLSREGSSIQAIKLRELLKELPESIELDKKLFIILFNISSTRHYFKLLRSLVFSANIPTTKFNNGSTFNKEIEIPSEFNN